MRILTRFVVVAALGFLAYVLFQEAHGLSQEEEPDSLKIVLLFVSVIAVAIVAGGIIGLSLMPAIGERIGNIFFNPNEQIEKNPHSRALTLVAQGDYEGAVAAYEAIHREDPQDTLALSEVVRICCDKLGRPEHAARDLEAALERDWPPEEAAFLASRLAEVYWNYQRDAVRARALLIEIAETLPDSKYAANAMHRVREIDHALAQEELRTAHHAPWISSDVEPGPSDREGEPAQQPEPTLGETSEQDQPRT